MSADDGSRVFLGKVTAYADGLGGVPVGARTYSGTKTRWGVVAVDPKVIPIGSAVRIEGYDDIIFIAEDVGGAIKGESLDIWLPDAAAAKAYGTQYRKITILREGPDRGTGTSGPVVTPSGPASDSLIPLSAPIIPSAGPAAP
jgi:3D (Asp-Asp-Asp) domain-containing protein